MTTISDTALPDTLNDTTTIDPCYFRMHGKTDNKQHTVAMPPDLACRAIVLCGQKGVQTLVDALALQFEMGGSQGSANGFIVDGVKQHLLKNNVTV